MKTPEIVALVGKVGHGKTLLLNKLTGSQFLSNASPTSCTRTLQYGYTIHEKLLIVDTPGFYASDNVAEHLAAQKVALEGLPLSGVYFVVKYGRADEVALEATRVIEFVGDDNIRIIITHSDTVSDDPGYDPDTLTLRVSDLIGLPSSNIFIVGKQTNGESIERFIHSTLHAPREYKVSMEQATSITSLCVCARRFDGQIRTVNAKIAAASVECNEKVAQYGRSHEVDVAITVIQKTTTDMVSIAKQGIFVDSEDMPEDQQHLIYGKAGLALAIKLKVFIDATNKLLSWDVTDPTDARNSYRSCPYCGAIFIKTEGCDGPTICGLIPSSVIKERPEQFAKILEKLQRLRLVNHEATNVGFFKPARSSIESGCGSEVQWATMIPIDPAKLKILGYVELQRPGSAENNTKKSFAKALKTYEAKNRNTLMAALSGFVDKSV